MRLFILKNSDGEYYAAENFMSKAYRYKQNMLEEIPVSVGSVLKFRSDLILLKSKTQVPDAMMTALESKFGKNLDLYFDLNTAIALFR